MKLALFIFNCLLVVSLSFAQSDSLLLEKIKNIDVSLNPDQYNEENLYLPEVSFQSFYDELSPYGEWIMIAKDEIDSELTKGEGQGYSSMNLTCHSRESGNPAAEDFLYIWRPSN